MSVWYYHWLVVRDLEWMPNKENAEHIHQALAKWGLAPKKPALQDIAGGRPKKLQGRSVAKSNALPANLLMTYHDPKGLTPSKNFLGPHELEADDPDWDEPIDVWLDPVLVVLGTDFKVFTDDYSGQICTVSVAPRNGARPVKPHAKFPVEVAKLAYPADSTTTPPSVKFNRSHDNYARQWSREYGAVWRSGIKLDCYQYIPAFAADDEARMELPDRTFVRDLEQAFGTQLTEVGMFG